MSGFTDVVTSKQPEPAPALTDDTALVNWIEREMQTQLGQGDLWRVMHQVHRGVPLREAVTQGLTTTDARHSLFEVGDAVLLDGRWPCVVLGFNWNYSEVLLCDPDQNTGWAVVTRLTHSAAGVP